MAICTKKPDLQAVELRLPDLQAHSRSASPSSETRRFGGFRESGTNVESKGTQTSNGPLVLPLRRTSPSSPPAPPTRPPSAASPQTKLILNCVGPFRLYGEPVVAACAESGCDYLDICGEPEFMERMEANYHEKAAETGSLVVSACGFDSVPAELGVIFEKQ